MKKNFRRFIRTAIIIIVFVMVCVAHALRGKGGFVCTAPDYSKIYKKAVKEVAAKFGVSPIKVEFTKYKYFVGGDQWGNFKAHGYMSNRGFRHFLELVIKETRSKRVAIDAYRVAKAAADAAAKERDEYFANLAKWREEADLRKAAEAKARKEANKRRWEETAWERELIKKMPSINLEKWARPVHKAGFGIEVFTIDGKTLPYVVVPMSNGRKVSLKSVIRGKYGLTTNQAQEFLEIINKSNESRLEAAKEINKCFFLNENGQVCGEDLTWMKIIAKAGLIDRTMIFCNQLSQPLQEGLFETLYPKFNRAAKAEILRKISADWIYFDGEIYPNPRGFGKIARENAEKAAKLKLLKSVSKDRAWSIASDWGKAEDLDEDLSNALIESYNSEKKLIEDLLDAFIIKKANGEWSSPYKKGEEILSIISEKALEDFDIRYYYQMLKDPLLDKTSEHGKFENRWHTYYDKGEQVQGELGDFEPWDRPATETEMRMELRWDRVGYTTDWLPFYIMRNFKAHKCLEMAILESHADSRAVWSWVSKNDVLFGAFKFAEKLEEYANDLDLFESTGKSNIEIWKGIIDFYHKLPWSMLDNDAREVRKMLSRESELYAIIEQCQTNPDKIRTKITKTVPVIDENGEETGEKREVVSSLETYGEVLEKMTKSLLSMLSNPKAYPSIVKAVIRGEMYGAGNKSVPVLPQDYLGRIQSWPKPEQATRAEEEEALEILKGWALLNHKATREELIEVADDLFGDILDNPGMLSIEALRAAEDDEGDAWGIEIADETTRQFEDALLAEMDFD